MASIKGPQGLSCASRSSEVLDGCKSKPGKGLDLAEFLLVGQESNNLPVQQTAMETNVQVGSQIYLTGGQLEWKPESIKQVDLGSKSEQEPRSTHPAYLGQVVTKIPLDLPLVPSHHL